MLFFLQSLHPNITCQTNRRQCEKWKLSKTINTPYGADGRYVLISAAANFIFHFPPPHSPLSWAEKCSGAHTILRRVDKTFFFFFLTHGIGRFFLIKHHLRKFLHAGCNLRRSVVSVIRYRYNLSMVVMLSWRTASEHFTTFLCKSPPSARWEDQSEGCRERVDDVRSDSPASLTFGFLPLCAKHSVFTSAAVCAPALFFCTVRGLDWRLMMEVPLAVQSLPFIGLLCACASFWLQTQWPCPSCPSLS